MQRSATYYGPSASRSTLQRSETRAPLLPPRTPPPQLLHVGDDCPPNLQSPFFLSLPEAGTPSNYYLLGRYLPDPPLLPSSFSDTGDEGTYMLTDDSLLNIYDKRRGDAPTVSGQHAVLRLDLDGSVFLRDYKHRPPYSTTRIYAPDSPSCFVSATDSAWTPVPHLHIIHINPFDLPLDAPSTSHPAPSTTFKFQLSAPLSLHAPASPSSRDSQDESHPSDAEHLSLGQFGFKFLLPGHCVGPILGKRGSVIQGLQREFACSLDLTRTPSFPHSPYRVLFLHAANSKNLTSACVRVAQLLANDAGPDGTFTPPSSLSLTIALPSDSGLISNPPLFHELSSGHPLCDIHIGRPQPHARQDRILTLNGPPEAVYSALEAIIAPLPLDPYLWMAADYDPPYPPPTRSSAMHTSRDSDGRHSRSDHRSTSTKRHRGHSDPQKQSKRSRQDRNAHRHRR
mmetsp:Transcript_41759/g.85370  ORF Transcript_41759/g.85370 Transcript_41759/m.85370 type:complete len:454 (+) Transcript_41759:436-1797(+)